jgi:hypothetical protein
MMESDHRRRSQSPLHYHYANALERCTVSPVPRGGIDWRFHTGLCIKRIYGSYATLTAPLRPPSATLTSPALELVPDPDRRATARDRDFRRF